MPKFGKDKVLLKLHRKYSKDEALSYLFSEISNLKVEIGMLKSENAELSYELEIRKDQSQYIEKLKFEIKQKQKSKQFYKNKAKLINDSTHTR